MLTEVLGGALAVTLASGAYLKYDNVSLENEILKRDNIISEKKLLIQSLKQDKNALNNSIEEQNNAIDTIKVDAKNRLDDYIKNTPNIAERVVLKYLKDINSTRGNCNDAKELNRYLDSLSL